MADKLVFENEPANFTQPVTHAAPVTFKSGSNVGFQGTVGFYGTAPAAKRASSVIHMTSNVVTSASHGTLQVAILQEIMNTLSGLGLWSV
jgi:hypothetical protein